MKRVLLIVSVSAFITAPGLADFTQIANVQSGSEAYLWQVLEVVTNNAIGTSTAYLNAGAGGRRVLDRPDAPGDIFDQFWRDGTVTVTATALWWGNTANEGSSIDQYFRYDDALDGSSPVITGVNDSGESVTFTMGSPEEFIIGVSHSDPRDAWSRESLNQAVLGQLDRAATFDVAGLDIYAWDSGPYSGPTTHLIRLAAASGSAFIVAFDTGSDGDFQDYMLLIEGAVPTPVPGAVLLGLLGLSAAGLKLRKFV